MHRREWGLGVLGVLVLAVMGGYGVGSPPAVPTAAAVTPSALPASVALPPAPQPVARAEPAVRQALSPSVGPATPLVERMRADWCGFGAQEAERQTQALLSGRDTVTPDTVAALSSTAGEQVLEQARQAAIRSWVEALRRRGDARSLAVAEWLGGDDAAATPPASSSRARLQALAQHATDPFITALALARPCAPGACRNVDPGQWSRLEPDNLQAWLPLLNDVTLRSSQAGYALERMSHQARYSHSYSEEVAQLVTGVLQAQQPGLAYQAETEALAGLFAVRAIPTYKALTASCREASAPCLTLAELLWSSEDLIERRMAFAVVRSSLPRSGSLRERWDARAREAEALAAFGERRSQAEIEAWAEAEKTAPCAPLPSQRQVVVERLTLGEWGSQRRALQAEGADVEALSAQWRREQGRSLLEPYPVVPGASAAR